MPPLGARERAALPDSAFAYVDSTGRRVLPIHDEAHVRNALARFSRVQFEDDAARDRARMRLLKAAKKHGIMPLGFVGGQFRPEQKLPRGHVTFLLADIEGSTGLLQRLGDGYGGALVQLRRLLRSVVRTAGGREIDARGDEYFGVFEAADGAVAAAIAIQRAVRDQPWPEGVGLRVRIGIHTGRASLNETGYVGLAVHTVARVCTSGHGGQIVISSATREALAGPLPDGIRAHEPRDLAPQRSPGIDGAAPGSGGRSRRRLSAAPAGRARGCASRLGELLDSPNYVAFHDAAAGISRQRSSRQLLDIGGFEMERHMLRLMLVLGVLVTILGGTGVFAVFSDQARGGPNTAESGARTHAADLLIASAVADYNASTVSCGRYTQNLETPQFAVSDLQPTSDRVESWVCLQNAGAAPLAIRVGSSSVSDLDVDCTGDEAAIGDATCGGLQAGELASRISVHVIDVDCRAFNSTSTHVEYLPSLAREPVQLRDAALAPGEQACVRLILDYDPFATEEQIQLAQSDRVTWSFIFEGTAS